MDYATIGALRRRPAGWRLLRAANATPILSFLGEFFVEGNRGASPVSEVAAALDDGLWATARELLADFREVEDNFRRLDRAAREEILLPFERPLYQPTATVEVESGIPPASEEVDTDLLFAQTFVDQARLIDNIHSLLPARSSALLSDIVDLSPIEQGAAEVVAYLAHTCDDIVVEMDERRDPPGVSRPHDLVVDHFGERIRLEQERIDWAWATAELDERAVPEPMT